MPRTIRCRLVMLAVLTVLVAGCSGLQPALPGAASAPIQAPPAAPAPLAAPPSPTALPLPSAPVAPRPEAASQGPALPQPVPEPGRVSPGREARKGPAGTPRPAQGPGLPRPGATATPTAAAAPAPASPASATLAPAGDEPQVTVSTPAPFLQPDGSPCQAAFSPSGRQYLCQDSTSPAAGRTLLFSGNAPPRAILPGQTTARWLDERRIVYVTQAPIDYGRRAMAVRLLDLESGQEVEVGATRWPWSVQTAAGGWVAFVDDERRVQVVNADSGASWQVATDFQPAVLPPPAPPASPLTPTPTRQPYPYVPVGYRLAPDGQKLALQFASDYRRGGPLVVVERQDAEHQRLIASRVPNAPEVCDWSPDGSQIAYSAEVEESLFLIRPELWVARADGAAPRRLLAGEGRTEFAYLRWADNGRYIFFVDTATHGMYPAGTARFLAIGLGGGPAKLLFTNGHHLELADGGRRMVYYHLIEGGVADRTSWSVTISYP